MNSAALIALVRDALEERGFDSAHLTDDDVWSFIELMLASIEKP